MEAAVTDWGPYTPYPSEYPSDYPAAYGPEYPLDEWSPGRHRRPAPERPPASPERPPAAPAGTGPGRRVGTATQPDGRDNDGRDNDGPDNDDPGNDRPGNDDPGNDDQVVELRNQVVDRLRLMNARHGRRAWERARSDPIAPHGLAFFYTDHHRQRSSHYKWRICTATRLFLDETETADLPRLLWEQTRIADGYRRAGTLDPRTQLANRADPMTEYARYFGVGVSTVDLPDFPWLAQRQSHTGFDIMGHCFALLADGAWLLLHRGLPGQFSALRIWPSHSLDIGPAMNLRRWNWGRHLPKLADPATRAIWLQLQALHAVLTAGCTPAAGHPGAGHGR